MSDSLCLPETHERLVLVEDRQTTQNVRLDDHEKRIRWIERIVNYGIGFAGAASLVYQFLIHH